VLAAAPGVSAQAKPSVKIGYLPADSFSALFILADRYLPAAGVTAEMVRLAGGPEVVSQVATGQLQLGGSGMGAAGFNAVASGLPLEWVAPLHLAYMEDYFVVRKASWGRRSSGSEISRASPSPSTFAARPSNGCSSKF